MLKRTEAAVTPTVWLRSIAKTFPSTEGNPPVRALDSIDLEIADGEFFAVVGPSGCGKSTLLEIIAGLSSATEGTYEFEGQRASGKVPEGVGVVFQEDSSFPWLTVADNISFGLRRLKNVPAGERKERVERVLSLMGLTDFAGNYPAQLSGGMRQRVCIARMLVAEPRLILLDEPFGALDQQTRLIMGEEVLRLWRETGATVFLITHALDEAAMLADRIGVMSARPGRLIDIVETGWPRERDSTIIEDQHFGAITARLWHLLRHESFAAASQEKKR
jgi:NitT/TauT family transport system ATP-binding protein